jgi:hypothetical protein
MARQHAGPRWRASGSRRAPAATETPGDLEISFVTQPYAADAHPLVCRPITVGAEQGVIRTRPAPRATEAQRPQWRFAGPTNQISHKDSPERPSLFLLRAAASSNSLCAVKHQALLGEERCNTAHGTIVQWGGTEGVIAARRPGGESPGYSCKASRSGCCW